MDIRSSDQGKIYATHFFANSGWGGAGALAMKLALLCPSLEPGRDGVGDYTRGLAAELLAQGHQVRLLALNDKFVESAMEGEQLAGAAPVRTLRLPENQEWDERIALAGAFLDAFQPDWVSLQFVCYGFQKKGFVYGLAKRMEPLLRGRKRHMMFHEIWIGEEVGFGWKRRLVGAVQRFFIRGFVREIQPDVMHTTNAAYQAILAREGIHAGKLPLFGAIPLIENPGFGWIEEQLKIAAGGDFQREGFWLFGIFGGLHSIWPPEPLLPRLLDAARAAGKRVALISIGRIGGGGQLWERISRDYADRMVFVRLGEQPPERVSGLLSFLDYGIATSPWLILEKSSTVVSMLEHGLPVIVNRDDARFHTPCGGPDDPLLMKSDERMEARLLAGVPKGARHLRREDVVRNFLTSLQQAGSSASIATRDKGNPA